VRIVERDDEASIFAQLVNSFIAHKVGCQAHSGDAGNEGTDRLLPSTVNRVVTTRMKQALALIEVKLMDHLIVGKSITSMRERGILT
jgi:hypothetical protein